MRIAMAAMLLLLSGCADVGYYLQSINGQLQLNAARRPVEQLMADADTPGLLKARLKRAAEIRRFASEELHLPDNGSYRAYADLKRPFVVWNVFAASEFSVEPRRWCFPVAGCVAYRGYFAKDAADAYASTLRADGFDVHVAGIPAYSTLGWFDDPLLNTFIQYPEYELARLIFHELAHQVAYVKGDSEFNESFAMAVGNTIWMKRTQGVGYLDLAGCITLGITGPILRSTGMPWDLRKSEPYCGYENYEFDVITSNECDVYGRFLIKMSELEQSLRIIEQCCDKLEKLSGAPVKVEDKKLGSPADLTVGPDGMGNSKGHIANIMTQSMEGLIHHFKLATEGFRVPAGQVYTTVESPRGELGAHLISDGGTNPYRVHFREPSFNNLQSLAAMCEGSMIADVVAAVASIDPVMGGVDR